MAQTSHAPHIAFLGTERQLAPLASLALYVAVVVTKWSTRHRTRRALSRLDAHHLRDIGLTRSQAQDEAHRLFWRG